MKIDVLLSPLNVDELYFTGKTVVVIDVLRATTVITRAIENGAREIIPVDSVEFAMKVSGNAFGGQTLLGGERNTKIIEGFHIGNSPTEYSAERVEGKSVILYTTNGSKAIVRAKFAEELLILSFNNISAIANHLIKRDNDFVLLCAGSNGMFCMEDTACAGKLIDIISSTGNVSYELSDSTEASKVIYETFGRDLQKLLFECEHGKTLIANGFEDDIVEAAKIDCSDVIPYFDSSVIKKWSSDFEKDEI